MLVTLLLHILVTTPVLICTAPWLIANKATTTSWIGTVMIIASMMAAASLRQKPACRCGEGAVDCGTARVSDMEAMPRRMRRC
jgi:hypothetical protein